MELNQEIRPLKLWLAEANKAKMAEFDKTKTDAIEVPA